MGAASCLECPSGSYCVANSTLPVACPEGAFCTAGVGAPDNCPAGRYSLVPDLHAASECAACPPGQYCSGDGGAPTGDCAASYFCRTSSPAAAPEQSIFSPVYDAEAWAAIDFGPCPPGHYCPVATADPIVCPNSTFRNTTHGASPDDCRRCPAGYICYPGEPVIYECPAGSYCSLGDRVAIECPTGTYNPVVARWNPDHCLETPAGYLTPQGATRYDGHVAPAGGFALAGATAATWCPAGSYNPLNGSTALAACQTCPAGSYCPKGSVTPTLCLSTSQGVFCPEGSGNYTVSPPGYYSPRSPPTTDPILCPESYFCPLGSIQPTRCTMGMVCPAGSAINRFCPDGSFGFLTANNSYVERR